MSFALARRNKDTLTAENNELKMRVENGEKHAQSQDVSEDELGWTATTSWRRPADASPDGVDAAAADASTTAATTEL
ncbi:hypothetical protein E2562_037969 [Oryza meyeriana var. granulata]|uniref:Uncharacterized protein n=1 Tax=Oryza meyeriana var. granulata TaxID=110450 RepID=A0A6G1CLR4_9ORYZ|nr:hypothetical protein E2562_037969 [Oryza meyeriana var. granulata]